MELHLVSVSDIKTDHISIFAFLLLFLLFSLSVHWIIEDLINEFAMQIERHIGKLVSKIEANR